MTLLWVYFMFVFTVWRYINLETFSNYLLVTAFYQVLVFLRVGCSVSVSYTYLYVIFFLDYTTIFVMLSLSLFNRIVNIKIKYIHNSKHHKRQSRYLYGQCRKFSKNTVVKPELQWKHTALLQTSQSFLRSLVLIFFRKFLYLQHL